VKLGFAGAFAMAGVLFSTTAGCTLRSTPSASPNSAKATTPSVSLTPTATPTVTATPAAAVTATSTPPTALASPTQAGPPACAVADQDPYVYHPDRLTVRAACVRVTGLVMAIRSEADGDLHIRVQLDSPFRSMLTPGNQQQCGQGVCGLLVVEPVCVHSVTQADAISDCAADPDPLKSLPAIGAHIWLEGRSVLDRDHYDWAELHPLYRWGLD